MRVHSSASIIATLNEACGEAASCRLVETYGGQRIDVPRTVMGRLLETLGRDITAVLVDHFGGCRIDVPSKGHTARIQKSMALRRDILTSGLSANDIAARHGVTNAWVRKLRADICGTPSSRPLKD